MTDIENDFLVTYQKCVDLGIAQQIANDSSYNYSVITHSTALEGSSITVEENCRMFENGVVIPSRSLEEHLMNIDLKRAYDKCFEFYRKDIAITPDLLKSLSAIVMNNTGLEYHTGDGICVSSEGDFRCFNVKAGTRGESYMSYEAVVPAVEDFCVWLGTMRRSIGRCDILDGYKLSIDAHYKLVTIHPWADGNGRMSRLLMHFLQRERNLIPLLVDKSRKDMYIEALQQTRASGDLDVFRTFMLRIHSENLKKEILSFEKNQGNTEPKLFFDDPC